MVLVPQAFCPSLLRAQTVRGVRFRSDLGRQSTASLLLCLTASCAEHLSYSPMVNISGPFQNRWRRAESP